MFQFFIAALYIIMNLISKHHHINRENGLLALRYRNVVVEESCFLCLLCLRGGSPTIHIETGSNGIDN